LLREILYFGLVAASVKENCEIPKRTCSCGGYAERSLLASVRNGKCLENLVIVLSLRV
jgi:hypothetical protein